MKWLLAIIYHPIMLITTFIILIQPFMLYDDIRKMIAYEVPVPSFPMVVLTIEALLIYIAMKSDFYGRPYRKIPVLLPLLQMFVYTSIALIIGSRIINLWADQGSLSKGMAVMLAVMVIVVIRLLMSLLYWKTPIVEKRGEVINGQP